MIDTQPYTDEAGLPATTDAASINSNDDDRKRWQENNCSCPMIQDLLRYQATHDTQTGLANLDLLLERVEQRISRGHRCHLVVLMITGINDIGEHHGVAAGLYALRTIAKRIKDTLGDYGLAARMQGGLFAAVSDNAAPQQLAQQLWQALNKPLLWHAEPLQLVVAAGVVNGAEHAGSAESLLQAGYAAAKDALSHNARGGINVFTAVLGQRLEHQYQVEMRLRSALLSDNLSLALQAKVCASGGHILGAEALVRWHDAHLGTVAPAEFIPLAERNGSIGKISAWVLAAALQQATTWHNAGLELTIAVNLSAIDLKNPELLANVQAALTASGCPPHKLIIELTESAVAEDPLQAIAQLQALKALGLSLALDDFGTGYSSLSYLHRFPIDTLKIDRSFVADTPADADAVAIVRSIVALAQALGMTTVAEGVETAAQAAFLRELGVNTLQGYFFSPPIPAEQFLALAQAKLAF
ncbi:bifunctional diguanylate cyclase/phosphodiesterase [Rheinheimera muenzenbergensis]|uniref:Bifunctional diguanylate cyclase/phosphodiesterase n=1 Tax=Rheinheimera muenzenbergensis TaxID=1193628 RepID=A0ABU8C1G4_9GAMM